MPYALPKPCRFPRCPALTRERFCAAHKQQVQREYDEARGTTTQRGYGTPWQRLRKRIEALELEVAATSSVPAARVSLSMSFGVAAFPALAVRSRHST